MSNPTIRDMIKAYLEQHGYSALADDDCGCAIDDLMPCDAPSLDNCVAAYQHKCTQVHPSCECDADRPTGELCPILRDPTEGKDGK